MVVMKKDKEKHTTKKLEKLADNQKKQLQDKIQKTQGFVCDWLN